MLKMDTEEGYRGYYGFREQHGARYSGNGRAGEHGYGNEKYMGDGGEGAYGGQEGGSKYGGGGGEQGGYHGGYAP